jgi:hypothetical protein
MRSELAETYAAETNKVANAPNTAEEKNLITL